MSLHLHLLQLLAIRLEVLDGLLQTRVQGLELLQVLLELLQVLLQVLLAWDLVVRVRVLVRLVQVLQELEVQQQQQQLHVQQQLQDQVHQGQVLGLQQELLLPRLYLLLQRHLQLRMVGQHAHE